MNNTPTSPSHPSLSRKGLRMHTATTSPKRAASARTTGRGTLLLLQGTLYRLEGALTVRISEPADDEADANASKSLDELETVNDLRTMMEDDSEDMVDPPLCDTTPAFITPTTSSRAHSTQPRRAATPACCSSHRRQRPGGPRGPRGPRGLRGSTGSAIRSRPTRGVLHRIRRLRRARCSSA